MVCISLCVCMVLQVMYFVSQCSQELSHLSPILARFFWKSLYGDLYYYNYSISRKKSSEINLYFDRSKRT